MFREGTPYQRRGSLQLWQFLVALLDDPGNAHFIAWTGRGMEFKLIEPEEVSGVATLALARRSSPVHLPISPTSIIQRAPCAGIKEGLELWRHHRPGPRRPLPAMFKSGIGRRPFRRAPRRCRVFHYLFYWT